MHAKYGQVLVYHLLLAVSWSLRRHQPFESLRRLMSEHLPGRIVSLRVSVAEEQREYTFFHLVRHGDRS